MATPFANEVELFGVSVVPVVLVTGMATLRLACR